MSSFDALFNEREWTLLALVAWIALKDRSMAASGNSRQKPLRERVRQRLLRHTNPHSSQIRVDIEMSLVFAEIDRRVNSGELELPGAALVGSFTEAWRRGAPLLDDVSPWQDLRFQRHEIFGTTVQEGEPLTTSSTTDAPVSSISPATPAPPPPVMETLPTSDAPSAPIRPAAKPGPGANAGRHVKADRQLFPEMTRIIKETGDGPYTVARQLLDRIQGSSEAEDESRIRRVAKRYVREVRDGRSTGRSID